MMQGVYRGRAVAVIDEWNRTEGAEDTASRTVQFLIRFSTGQLRIVESVEVEIVFESVLEKLKAGSLR